MKQAIQFVLFTLLLSLAISATASAQQITFNLLNDSTGGTSVVPTGLSLQIPAVGATTVFTNRDFHSVYSHNGGVGWFFSDNPYQAGSGQETTPVITMTRPAANRLILWIDFQSFQTPTVGDLYPSGRGPVTQFEAEWFDIDGQVKLLVKSRYLVMSYLDVNNRLPNGPGKRQTMPDSFKDRPNLAGDSWQVPNGGLVSWGVIESPGPSAKYVVMQFDRNANGGKVNVGELVVRR